MKLEMHAHDCEVSQCAVITAKDLVDGYKDAGYDGIVITNHFDQITLHILGATPEEQWKAYMRGYELAKEEGERVGLTVILGMEVRLNCGPGGFSGIRCDGGIYPGTYGSVWMQPEGTV